MTSYITQYGEIKGISENSTYPGGSLKDCVIKERVELHTPLGLLTPQYEHSEVRRKHIYSVSFYENGKMSRIALNEQTRMKTPVGILPAELITFYENGNIKRLFPLNGQISGFWSEDDEYTLAGEFSFHFSFGDIKAKIIGIYFYEDGKIQSLTFWPKDIVSIKTPIGEQRVRIGFSLYPDGSIKSFEPAEPIDVMTPAGIINSYDTNANGIAGDKNSINFTEEGKIKSLITTNTKISVTGHNTVKTYSPAYIRDMDEHEIFFLSLKVSFDNDKVTFNDRDEYLIRENIFVIERYIMPKQNSCSDCSSCSQLCNSLF
jgi:antitoxin component YwqK of YwqJK toxin-antitoxin module